MYKKIQDFLTWKSDPIRNKKKKEILEKNQEIFKLFLKAESNEDIQILERWLLR